MKTKIKPGGLSKRFFKKTEKVCKYYNKALRGLEAGTQKKLFCMLLLKERVHLEMKISNKMK